MLRTLLPYSPRIADAFRLAAFGSAAPVAVAAAAGRPETAVRLSGRWLSASALGLETPATKDRVATCRAAQVLAACAACAGPGSWPGGFLLLRTPAGALLNSPLKAAKLEAAAAAVLSARAGGKPCGGVADVCTHQGELLEAAGRFEDAAAVYQQNIDAAARAPRGESVLQSAPTMWANVGVALWRAACGGARPPMRDGAAAAALARRSLAAFARGLDVAEGEKRAAEAAAAAAATASATASAAAAAAVDWAESTCLYICSSASDVATMSGNDSAPWMMRTFKPTFVRLRACVEGSDDNGEVTFGRRGGTLTAEARLITSQSSFVAHSDLHRFSHFFPRFLTAAAFLRCAPKPVRSRRAPVAGPTFGWRSWPPAQPCPKPRRRAV